MVKEIDYDKLGFKSGLEIHQQLDSNKLFCNCPSLLRQEGPDFVINRKLHAVAGESGEVDVAAAYQASLNKEYEYQAYDTTCLVELDEEPPHQINQEALKTILHIALLFHAKIIPLAQIMRKTVIDGSNTSGFQRTVMIARDGYIETDQGRVGIEGIFLEEDSARLVTREKNKTIFRLDRLGIPLVEVATAPDIKNAKHARETALKIGGILRSCKVKRGIGSIRQDINISIKGSERVELKGFQDPKIMIKTVENEVKRQVKNLKTKDNKSEVRNVLPDGKSEFLRPMPGEARMYPETDLPLLKISRQMINEAKKTLPKLLTKVKEDLEKEGLNQEMIGLLFKQNMLEEFKELNKIINNPNLVAKLLTMYPKEIAKHESLKLEKVNKILTKDVFVSVLENLKKKKIKQTQVKHVLERIVKGKSHKEAVVFEKEDIGNVEEKVMKLIKSKPGLSSNAYMGLVMKEFRGKIDGREAMEIIRKFVK